MTVPNIPARSLLLDRGAIDRFRQQFSVIVEDFESVLNEAEKLYQADTWPIPPKVRRELYFDDDHIAYWLSGLLDFEKIASRLQLNRNANQSILEIGCASGRLMRHFLSGLPKAKAWGLDIKRSNIDWLRSYLPSSRLNTLHNSALPSIPMDGSQFDVVAALSVFTHIDIHEEEWLLELHRVLKPGGRIYLTVITDRVWHEMGPGKILASTYSDSQEFSTLNFAEPMPAERIVLHSVGVGPAYMETVIHSRSYIDKNWSRFFSSLTWLPGGHDFQDVLILKK